MTQPDDMPEWSLDQSEVEVENHRFSNVNPRAVFLLALAVAFLTVICVYGFYLLVNLGMDAGIVAQPPRLQELVD